MRAATPSSTNPIALSSGWANVLMDTPIPQSVAAATRDELILRFREIFARTGLIQHASEPINSDIDKSTRFVGSTISIFKRYLDDPAALSPGYFAVQPCLRTRNMKALFDYADDVEWASHFTSCGAVSRYENLGPLCKTVWEWVAAQPGVTPKRTRIRIASSDTDLVDAWASNGLSTYLELDTREPVYYTHVFGIEGITGRNCNLAIYSKDGQTLRDIGNVIVIERLGVPFAVEVAFGIETIASRILDLPSAISASPISDCFTVGTKSELKLADALAASIAMIDAGVRPFSNNRGRILRSYIEAIMHLQPHTRLGLDDIAQLIVEYANRRFPSSTAATDLYSYLATMQLLIGKGHTPRSAGGHLFRALQA